MPAGLKVENMTLIDGIYHAKNIPETVDEYTHGLESLFSIYTTSFWHIHRTNCVISCINKHIKPNISWFADVGGGGDK